MPNTPPQLIAGGQIFPHRFIKLDTAEELQGLQAVANDVLIGISGPPTKFAPLSDLVTTNPAAEDGDSFLLKGDGEIDVMVEAGGTFSAGVRLKSDLNGKAVAVLTTGTAIQNWGAVALQASTAINQLIKVQVQIGSERPALV